MGVGGFTTENITLEELIKNDTRFFYSEVSDIIKKEVNLEGLLTGNINILTSVIAGLNIIKGDTGMGSLSTRGPKQTYPQYFDQQMNRYGARKDEYKPGAVRVLCAQQFQAISGERPRARSKKRSTALEVSQKQKPRVCLTR